MNYGNDSIKPFDLVVRPLDNSIVPKFSKKYGQPILEIHKPADYHWIEKKKISKNRVIDLIYKFNLFLEYNKNPKNYNIEKIEFETEDCFGVCPYFKLIINNDKSATFNAISGNSIYEKTSRYGDDNMPEIKGIFKTKLNDQEYNQLISILNYLDFPNMQNKYSIDRLHSSYCKIKITYDNQMTKSIEDYGMCGTYGLMNIYTTLFNIRFNQEWK